MYRKGDKRARGRIWAVRLVSRREMASNSLQRRHGSLCSGNWGLQRTVKLCLTSDYHFQLTPLARGYIFPPPPISVPRRPPPCWWIPFDVPRQRRTSHSTSRAGKAEHLRVAHEQRRTVLPLGDLNSVTIILARRTAILRCTV